jgi:hypothetical protein
MKSIQYIFDNDIIRIWNEEILSTDFEKDNLMLTIEDKKHNNII